MRFAVALVTVVLVAACAAVPADDRALDGGADGRGGGGDDGVVVLASTTIWGDVARAVVGDAGTVEVLLQPGADPHAASASAAQADRLRDADLVLVNGLGLEGGLLDAVDAAEVEGTRVLELGAELDPLPASGAGGGAEEALDPHVWMDPLRVADAVDLVADALDEAAPSAAAWQDRAADVRASIEAAHARAEDLLAGVPDERRALVTDHDALAYFAERYGFDVVGSVVPSTSSLAESSAADLEALARVIRERDVPAIFVDTTVPTTLADAVAAEVGRDVQVVALATASVGGPEDPASYVELVTDVAERVAEALGA